MSDMSQLSIEDSIRWLHNVMDLSRLKTTTCQFSDWNYNHHLDEKELFSVEMISIRRNWNGRGKLLLRCFHLIVLCWKILNTDCVYMKLTYLHPLALVEENRTLTNSIQLCPEQSFPRVYSYYSSYSCLFTTLDITCSLIFHFCVTFHNSR